MKRYKLLVILFGVIILAACSSDAGDNVQEVIKEVEVTKEAKATVEVVKEVEVATEAEVTKAVVVAEEVMPPTIDEIAPLQPTAQSIGQESSAQSTPFAPRDKQGAQTVGTSQADVAFVVNVTTDVVRGDGESAIADNAATPLATGTPAVRSENPTTIPVATSPVATKLPATAVATSLSPRPVLTPTPFAEDVPALKAGVVDDNADFAAYLRYLGQYDGEPIEPVDVSLRQRFVVLDSAENPLLGAQISIFDNGNLVKELRTHADGGAWFFPNTISQPPPARYDVEVRYQDQAIYAGSFAANSVDGEKIIRLNGNTRDDLQLDILLLLDATGSMGDEIAELKANLQTIIQRTVNSAAQPDLRFGLVTYRDLNEEFVTRVVNFSADFAQIEAELKAVQALGGGDYPEDLDQALHDALNRVSWRENAIQLIFLVADAPPHLDYDLETVYTISALSANERGIKIYPIASSGLDDQGEYVFRQLAQLTGSEFIFLVDDVESAGDQGGDSAETTFSVDNFTVAALDDVVMTIIERELAYQTR